MFVLELQVLPVLWRSPEGSGAPMDFADVGSIGFALANFLLFRVIRGLLDLLLCML